MHLRLLGWSLRHRRWRSLLSLIMMTVTASVVVLFVSVISNLLEYVNANADRALTRILIMPKAVASELPLAMYTTLKNIDGVQVVQRYRYVSGRHKNGTPYVVVGEEDSGIELNGDLFPVEPDVFEAWKKERPMGAIVTDAFANDLRLTVGQLAEVPTTTGPIKVKIVGISRGGTIAQRIAGHFEYFQELAGNPGTCRYRAFSKPEDFERVARAIDETTKNTATPVQAVSASKFAASQARRAGTVPAVLGFLGLFLVFTTSLTLANTTAISIRERRTETATMRVLGYRRFTIASVMLSEAVLIGVIGGLFAVAITYFAFTGMQLIPGATLKPVEIGTTGIVAGILTSILVPLAGAVPSVYASMRMPLIDALRDA